MPLSAIGEFLALRTPHAARLQAALKERGVWTDYRGDLLRLGPAPYVGDRMHKTAIDILSVSLRSSG